MAQPFKHPTTGVYYTRRRVPRELREALGHEYKKSLGTRDAAEAKRLHVLELANCDVVFARARAQASGTAQLTGRDAQVLAGRWFEAELAKVDASARYEDWLASGSPVTWERGDDCEEHTPMVTLCEALDADGEELTADHVLVYVKQTLKERGLQLPPVNSPVYGELVSAFMSHYRKLSETALARHHSGWSPAPPTLAGDALSTEAGAGSKRKSPKLLEVFEGYARERILNDGNSRAVNATLVEYRARMLEFVELCNNPDVCAITRAMVADYRELVAQLPVKGEGIRKLSAREKIAKAKAENLPVSSAGNVSNKLRALSAVLSFAVRREFIKENPVIAGQFLTQASKALTRERLTKSDRKYYSDDELTDIFTSPIYSKEGWTAPRAAFGQAWYWMPLLLYYTGARLEELAQLRAEEVSSDDPHPHLSILNKEGADEEGRGVKNAGSRRSIPLHPDLIKLGFAEYVAGIGKGQLFPGLKPDPKGYYGTNFGRRWAVYLRDVVGLQSPANPAHGFRHTFKTLCREAGINEDVHDAITGHSGGGGEARKYGTMPLLRMSAEIAQLRSAPLP